VIYEIETIKVKLKIREETQQSVNSPAEVARVAREIFTLLDADQEHFILLALDSKNQIKGYKVISSGGQASADPDMKIVFRSALFLGAISIIVAHNHPSGDPEPSEEDRQFTKKLKEAGELLTIRVLDHLIIGDNDRWYSFSNERGL